tara:strand:+ start:924 stop:1091 length:168 start_codon:yes stop_codon:yes gene_type:complete
MIDTEKRVYDFCKIQIQILSEREKHIRKELLDCKIQQEFIMSLLNDLSLENKNEQ